MSQGPAYAALTDALRRDDKAMPARQHPEGRPRFSGYAAGVEIAKRHSDSFRAAIGTKSK